MAGGAQQVAQVHALEPEESTPFVGAALRQLREEIGNQSTVLGCVGAPFTLASYIVEGGSSKSFAHIKRMAFTQPEASPRPCALKSPTSCMAFRGIQPWRTSAGDCAISGMISCCAVPQVLHALNTKLADMVADYVRYQVRLASPQKNRFVGSK